MTGRALFPYVRDDMMASESRCAREIVKAAVAGLDFVFNAINHDFAPESLAAEGVHRSHVIAILRHRTAVTCML